MYSRGHAGRAASPAHAGAAAAARLACLSALLLAACNAPKDAPADTDRAADTDTGAPSERPILTSPAEAVDQDPAEGVFHVELRAAPATYEVDGAAVDGYAWNGQVPGPTIRVGVGDTVTALLQNDLADPTTAHWHGLRVPAAMDGAGWVDGGVAPGTAYTYTFTATSPGTFWYHPHLDVGAQVDAGLYGTLVVEDPADPAPDREVVLVFDAWNEHDPADLDAGAGDDHHALTDPSNTLWTVNGLVDPRFPATAGERIRVRAVNAANTSYLALSWPDMRLVATDQGRLGAPESPESVVLAPGDRAEFEWVVTRGFDVETLPWVASGGAAFGDPRRLLSVEADAGAATPLDWPAGDATPAEDPGRTDLLYVFQGGGTGDWLIDGEAWPDVTVKTAALDADTIVEVRNLSATNHPFHLHGQRFEVLSVDGVPVPARRVEDTVDVGIRQTVRLLLHADNPGDWLLHCHLLGHEEGGMMTLLRVE
ncbi:MAG: multicopper oxidase family protein, partial [Myxococcota bacterium]